MIDHESTLPPGGDSRKLWTAHMGNNEDMLVARRFAPPGELRDDCLVVQKLQLAGQIRP